MSHGRRSCGLSVNANQLTALVFGNKSSSEFARSSPLPSFLSNHTRRPSVINFTDEANNGGIGTITKEDLLCRESIPPTSGSSFEDIDVDSYIEDTDDSESVSDEDVVELSGDDLFSDYGDALSESNVRGFYSSRNNCVAGTSRKILPSSRVRYNPVPVVATRYSRPLHESSRKCDPFTRIDATSRSLLLFEPFSCSPSNNFYKSIDLPEYNTLVSTGRGDRHQLSYSCLYADFIARNIGYLDCVRPLSRFRHPTPSIALDRQTVFRIFGIDFRSNYFFDLFDRLTRESDNLATFNEGSRHAGVAIDADVLRAFGFNVDNFNDALKKFYHYIGKMNPLLYRVTCTTGVTFLTMRSEGLVLLFNFLLRENYGVSTELIKYVLYFDHVNCHYERYVKSLRAVITERELIAVESTPPTPDRFAREEQRAIDAEVRPPTSVIDCSLSYSRSPSVYSSLFSSAASVSSLDKPLCIDESVLTENERELIKRVSSSSSSSSQLSPSSVFESRVVFEKNLSLCVDATDVDDDRKSLRDVECQVDLPWLKCNDETSMSDGARFKIDLINRLPKDTTFVQETRTHSLSSPSTSISRRILDDNGACDANANIINVQPVANADSIVSLAVTRCGNVPNPVTKNSTIARPTEKDCCALYLLARQTSICNARQLVPRHGVCCESFLQNCCLSLQRTFVSRYVVLLFEYDGVVDPTASRDAEYSWYFNISQISTYTYGRRLSLKVCKPSLINYFVLDDKESCDWYKRHLRLRLNDLPWLSLIRNTIICTDVVERETQGFQVYTIFRELFEQLLTKK